MKKRVEKSQGHLPRWNSNNTSVSSILKNPTRSKSTHQRSVHFEEPKSNNESSIDAGIFTIDKPEVLLRKKLVFLNLKKKVSKNLENQTTLLNNQNHKNQDSLKTSQVTPISEAKSKNSTKNTKKIFASKILKFEFRDQDFYEKLNKFMNAKESLSPEKSANSSGSLKPESLNKEKKGLERWKNNETPGNSKEPQSKTIHKKSTTPLMRKKYIHKSSTTKYSKAHNVLN